MPTFPCVSVAVFDENQLPHPPEQRLDRKGMEAVIDEDISRFEQYFAGLGDPSTGLNEKLLPMERAAIKTWLYWKLFEEKP